MSWIKRLFNRKLSKTLAKESAEAFSNGGGDFTIEYYPFSNMYFPKFKGKYIQSQYPSMILKTTSDNLFADKAYTEKGAEEIIAKFKEQRLKQGILIIKK